MTPTFRSEAPIEYRGCVIHFTIEGDAVYTIMTRHPLRALTWEELRPMIDRELDA